MPPKPLLDLENLDVEQCLSDAVAIRQKNSQRHEMEMLDRIIHFNPDRGEIAGLKKVRADEFWVRGHFPDRPLFPGVLMIEAAGQLASFYVASVVEDGGVLGFAGADHVKFRSLVQPGDTLLLLGLLGRFRGRQAVFATQAFVDGALVFEAQITGMMI